MLILIILKIALLSLWGNKLRSFLAMLGNITDSEVDRLSRVCVLGPVTAKNLFGVDDPIDEVIKLNGVNFRVTGVLKAKGDQGWFNPDDQVIIPYTTAMKQVLGVNNLREI